jgi:hypothetical protein
MSAKLFASAVGVAGVAWVALVLGATLAGQLPTAASKDKQATPPKSPLYDQYVPPAEGPPGARLLAPSQPPPATAKSRVSISKTGTTTVPAKKAASWEYRVIEPHPTAKEATNEFNALGADGWEYVEHFRQPTNGVLWFLFKRPARAADSGKADQLRRLEAQVRRLESLLTETKKELDLEKTKAR